MFGAIDHANGTGVVLLASFHVSSLSCVVFPQSKAIHEARFEAARKTGVEPATAVARRAAATAAATTRPPYFFLGASATRGWCSAGTVLYWRTVMMHYDRREYLSGHDRIPECGWSGSEPWVCLVSTGVRDS